MKDRDFFERAKGTEGFLKSLRKQRSLEVQKRRFQKRKQKISLSVTFIGQ